MHLITIAGHTINLAHIVDIDWQPEGHYAPFEVGAIVYAVSGFALSLTKPQAAALRRYIASILRPTDLDQLVAKAEEKSA